MMMVSWWAGGSAQLSSAQLRGGDWDVTMLYAFTGLNPASASWDGSWIVQQENRVQENSLHALLKAINKRQTENPNSGATTVFVFFGPTPRLAKQRSRFVINCHEISFHPMQFCIKR